MSNPASETALKDYLIAHDEHYRELANEHHQYDERLSELLSLTHPNEDEKTEEIILKKKKLQLKDQMEFILSQYKTSATSH
ncbi:MAG TPA: DUF465 domain-containing protein [Blastocatellia bacterium]|nr:DUF465 domain-containing protein [Blastocatellia bacterium]